MTRPLLLLLFFFTFSINAQKNITPNGEDTQTAKKLKAQYPDDHIALLFSEDYVTFGFNNKQKKVTVNHNMEESLINLDSRSDIQKFCFYDGESEIKAFKVKFKNNRDTKKLIQDEAYTSDDLFHIDTRVKFTNLSFPLKGYKYLTSIEKKYHDIKYFTKLYFNNLYPAVKKVIKIEVPSWLDIELKEMNFDGFSIKKDVAKDEKTQTNIYTYTLNNVEAMTKEEHKPGPTYIYPHILILPKHYTKDGQKEVIFNSTQDLYNWYKSLVENLKHEEAPYKQKVLYLTKDAKTDDEKVKNIFYWVQDNIRYIAFEDGLAGFIPDEAANVYNKKYGDCKGMANLIKQMLIEAGFDARLTWIGTKRIAYDYSTPNLSVDNHMICTLFKDGKPIFLDGTEKFNAYGEYANRIQGKQVMIENGDEYILETVPEITTDFNTEQIRYSLSLNNDILEGKASKQFHGESRSSLLYYFDSLKNDKKDEFLEYYLNNGNTNIKVSNITTSDLLNRDLALEIAYNISIKNMVSTFDNEMYIDIDFDKEFEDFTLDKRKTDYIFDFKRALNSETTLKIPSGYKVSQLPNNITVKSDNYELAVTFSEAEGIITYSKVFSMKNAKIETTDFEEWNDFISKLKNIYNEQIVLIKS